MRKLLIAAIVVLFSVGAHAQEYTPPLPTMPTMPTMQAEKSDGWRMVAVGAGALAGIWAVNAATGGLAAGPMVAAMQAGSMTAFTATLTASRIVLVGAGAIAGGYIGGWFYDG